jgi:hypothetical protein
LLTECSTTSNSIKNQILFILDQVKHGDSIAHWRKKATSVRREKKVPFAVNCAQQIRKLVRRKHVSTVNQISEHSDFEIRLHAKLDMSGLFAIHPSWIDIHNKLLSSEQ